MNVVRQSYVLLKSKFIVYLWNSFAENFMGALEGAKQWAGF